MAKRTAKTNEAQITQFDLAPIVEKVLKSTVKEAADACMSAAANHLKIEPGIIYRSRETTMKVKLEALNAIDKITAPKEGEEEMDKKVKAFWRNVKLDISVR